MDSCVEAGIPFFTLGSGFSADNPVIGNEVVCGVAADLDRTPARIALAWALAIAPDVLLVSSTSSLARLAVADIELDDDRTRPTPSRHWARWPTEPLTGLGVAAGVE